MTVARDSVCKIAWHKLEQPVAKVRGVASVAAIVPIFPTGAYRRYRETPRYAVPGMQQSESNQLGSTESHPGPQPTKSHSITSARGSHLVRLRRRDPSTSLGGVSY